MTAVEAAAAFDSVGLTKLPFEQPYLVVADDGSTDLTALRDIPAVVVAVSLHNPAWADVVVADADATAQLTAAVEANPSAALVLVQQLRLAEQLSLADGLVAESLAYATLQHGAEFRLWLSRQGRKVRPAFDEPAVLVDDTGDTVRLTLNRPRLRNALSAQLRDAWVEALTPLALRPEVAVIVDGAGPAFSIGGDLAEFGTTDDTALSHRIRMVANVAPAIAAIADRCQVDLHGACVGAGIELAAFAGHLTAAANTTITLPEVRMGLIPGAGGTVSIPGRIGRHATTELALTGRTIDATEALALGLVDEVI